MKVKCELKQHNFSMTGKKPPLIVESNGGDRVIIKVGDKEFDVYGYQLIDAVKNAMNCK